MKYNQFIRLTKLESLNEFSKINNSTWVFDSKDNWFCEGYLASDVKVNEQLTMIRIANYDNPQGKLGTFNTSTIQKIDNIDEKTFKLFTLNSIYFLEIKEYNKDNYPNIKFEIRAIN